MDPKTENYSKLKCEQINIRHSGAATLHLSQILLDLDIDIVLVQEPYAKPNLFLNDIIPIPFLPDQYTVHHNLNEDHAYCEILWLFLRYKWTVLLEC
jgi:hypothetical protein